MQPVTHTRSEYGGSMAWTAVFMAAVLVPLLMITVDISRLLYARGQLQIAADAGCEAAAWAGADRRAYRDHGATAIDTGLAAQAGSATFSRVMAGAKFPIGAGFRMAFSTQAVNCTASTSVPLIFGGLAGAQTGSGLSIGVQAVSTYRFGGSP